jgi:hypothetical protein
VTFRVDTIYRRGRKYVTKSGPAGVVKRNTKKKTFRASIFITGMNKNCGKRALIRAPIPITSGGGMWQETVISKMLISIHKTYNATTQLTKI